MTEKWKRVLGYESYMVSDAGSMVRVRTYGKEPKAVWKPVAARPKKDGYITYHLCEDGVRKDPLAHRLVWEAHVGSIAEGFEINHKNGIKADNRLVNLECITRSENMKHKFRVLKCPAPNNPNHGSKNGSAKLTEEDIPRILEMHRSGITQTKIARTFGVTQPAIGNIIAGRSWTKTSQPKPGGLTISRQDVKCLLLR
jgi:HNH endonuclease